METTVAVLLIATVCVIVVVALLLRERRTFRGDQEEFQGDSDDGKVELTIYINKEELERLLGESQAVPAKEELDSLKSKLGIEKGSLQLKSGAVYHVTYDADVRKHKWKRLGPYGELASQVLSNG